MNFGTIKDILAEQLVDSQLKKDKKGKELYKNFIKEMKNNKVLKSQFIVYKNIENKSIKSESEASEYLKENIEILKKIGTNKILESNVKLSKLLKKVNPTILKEYKEKDIHLAIHNLITKEKDANNLNLMHESFQKVKKWLMEEKSIEGGSDDSIVENVDPKKFLEIVTKKYNEKYSELTEEEKTILKVLRNGNKEEIKTLVSEMVKNTISVINENIKKYEDNLDVKERLLETKDVVYSMVENDDSFSDNLMKLYELKRNLRDDS